MDALFDPVDHAASSAELSSADLAVRARAHLRLSRQHEARALLLAQQVGESAYNDALNSQLHPRGRMSGRKAAERATVDAVALGLRISKTKAGRWMADGEALQRHPKIRARYLAGDFSTNRVEKVLRAADVAPDVEPADDGCAAGSGEERRNGEDDAAADGGAPTLDGLLEDSPFGGEDAAIAPDTVVDGDVGGDDSGGVDTDVDVDADVDADVEVDRDTQDADELTIDFDDLALDLADRPTTDKALEGALNDLIVDLDPDRAAEVREEFAEAWQNVTITTDAAGHTAIEICAPADQGVFLGHRIRELLSARVCPADPRTTGQQRVMAHAELIGVPGARLDCRCGRDDCRVRGDRGARVGKRPARNVTPPAHGTPSGVAEGNHSGKTVEGAKNAQTVDASDRFGGGGRRDTEEADGVTEVAEVTEVDEVDEVGSGDTAEADATVEVADAAAPSGRTGADILPVAVGGETGSAARVSDVVADTSPSTSTGSPDCGDGTGDATGIAALNAPAADTSHSVSVLSDSPIDLSIGGADAEPDPDVDAVSDAGRDTAQTSGDTVEPEQPPWTLILDPTDRRPPRLRGYGAIDPDMAAHLAPRARIITPSSPPPRPAALIITDRTLAPPVDPTGHGGFVQPPPGALTYAPSAHLRADVEGCDQTCRYPMCSVQAHLCELDHLVKFDHADPMAGGWTLLENLIPLCLPDHQRKHMGLWIPTMHTDRTVRWRNPRTGDEILTYPR